MDEPRTHYQVSFTSRQAVALFVVLVIALAGSYFLGLLTGLSGRQRRALETAAAATPSPEPAFPAPVLGVPARGVATRRTPTPRPTEKPTAAATPGLQLFEDRPSSEATRPPAAAKTAPTKAPVRSGEASGFWVQVESLSSKDQAETRRRGLAGAGFTAAVVPGSGPKGAVYRVRVGPYATREEADRTAAKLAAKAKVKPWVVPPGQ
jgi:cell division septation protein DedD